MASLLNNASLLLNPAGSIIAYEEDKILSVLPSNGTGDFTFSGGDGGTRVNQQGYIEVTPANTNTYSEKFGPGYWNNYGGTITDDSVIAPNGTVTGTTFNGSPAGAYKTFYGITVGQVYTVSMYVKLGTATNCVIIINNTINWNTVGGKSFTSTDGLNTTDWTRISFTFTGPASGQINWHIGYHAETAVTQQTNGTYFVWGAQLNIGSTAKPYQPTTDRLNYPRITYQNGRGALLSEPQRTNLVLYSQQFNVGWTLYQGATLTPSASLSPDGTQNAFALNVATVGYSGIYQSTGGGTIVATTSIFAKKGTLDWILMVDSAGGAGRAWFNLANGTIGTVVGGWVAKIEPFKDGWYRCILQNPSANIFGLQVGASTGDNVVTPATTGNIYIWGAQLEAGSYPTSYIPTTSATVTRPLDQYSVTNLESKGLTGTNVGTLYLSVANTANSYDGGTINAKVGGGGNFPFNYMILDSTGTANRVRIFNSVAQTAAYTFTETVAKIAVTTDGNNSSVFVNGIKKGTSAGLTAGIEEITQEATGAGLRYTTATYTTALSDSDAQTLTTIRSGSGGNISYYGPYTIHTFTGSATFTPSFNGQVEVLVVAGGGGGGQQHGGGGGGAGGLLYTSAYGVSAGTGITVTVGSGGAITGNGSNSVFGGLTTIGGGLGASEGANNGGNGGSGGGGTGFSTATNGGSGIPGQGFDGGKGGFPDTSGIYGSGGGGGGASAPGTDGKEGQNVSGSAGNGGNGLPYSINGFSTYYAGGGGGGYWGDNLTYYGVGGLGGGGNGGAGGSASTLLPTPGVNGLGGGGGGARGDGSLPRPGSVGGSGVVIVRYLT